MKFTIQTFQRVEGGHRLLKETRCGSTFEALRVWSDAMLDFTVDRIYITVDKP